MNASERKLIELTQKVASLRTEFEDWQRQSEARQFLEKHYTQIRRLTAQMEGYLSVLDAGLGPLREHLDRVGAASAGIESDIVDAHRIWDYFRSKFIQRCMSHYQTFLYSADEFAWACYEPAQKLAVAAGMAEDRVKEPPLVFFHIGRDLLATRRNSSYAEGLKKGGLTRKQFIDILKPLPIPLIGVPWFQIQHLPDVLILGHEVGHHVEDDFLRLQEGGSRPGRLVEDAVRGLPPDRRNKWRLWQGEVFADIYGTLAAGPAFAGALLDLLSGDGRAPEQSLGSTHPPPALRLRVALEVLRQDFPQEVEVREREVPAWPRDSVLSLFVDDIPRVVRALLDGPYPELGNRTSLPDVIQFARLRHDQALQESRRMLAGYRPNDDDPRTLFACARLAYEESPATYVERKVHTFILEKIPRRVGVRGEEMRKSPDRLKQIDVLDQAAGRNLFSTISKMRQRTGVS
jgi:hypothetical protein